MIELDIKKCKECHDLAIQEFYHGDTTDKIIEHLQLYHPSYFAGALIRAQLKSSNLNTSDEKYN